MSTGFTQALYEYMKEVYTTIVPMHVSCLPAAAPLLLLNASGLWLAPKQKSQVKICMTLCGCRQLGVGVQICTWLTSPRNIAMGKAMQHAMRTFTTHLGGHTQLLNQPRARGLYRRKQSQRMPIVNPSMPRSKAMWYSASPRALSCSLREEKEWLRLFEYLKTRDLPKKTYDCIACWDG